MNHQRTNIVLRSFVWLAFLAWWVYLRKPAESTLLDVRPGLATLLGVVLTVAGLLLYAWAARALASSVPSAVVAPAVLLRRGPYRYVRNPLYLGAAAIFIGVSTMYRPWQTWDLLAIVAVALLVHLLVVGREEPAARSRLGPPYIDYCARVPRWVPRYASHE